MNEDYPDNLICGITIDVTPRYPNANAKKRCRPELWEEDEINDKLRKLLERGAIESMTRQIKKQFDSPSYLRVCAETTAYGWMDEDEDDEDEVFSIEIDIFGDPDLLDPLSDIVGDIDTGEAVCKDLRPLLVRYATEACPEAKLKWKLEPTEYGE